MNLFVYLFIYFFTKPHLLHLTNCKSFFLNPEGSRANWRVVLFARAHLSLHKQRVRTSRHKSRGDGGCTPTVAIPSRASPYLERKSGSGKTWIFVCLGNIVFCFPFFFFFFFFLIFSLFFSFIIYVLKLQSNNGTS